MEVLRILNVVGLCLIASSFHGRGGNCDNSVYRRLSGQEDAPTDMPGDSSMPTKDSDSLEQESLGPWGRVRRKILSSRFVGPIKYAFTVFYKEHRSWCIGLVGMTIGSFVGAIVLSCALGCTGTNGNSWVSVGIFIGISMVGCTLLLFMILFINSSKPSLFPNFPSSS